MNHLIKQLRAGYDTVVTGVPPLLALTDTALLASQADGELVVTHYGRRPATSFPRRFARADLPVRQHVEHQPDRVGGDLRRDR